MDYHILIVIAIVFLVSILSVFFMNIDSIIRIIKERFSKQNKVAATVAKPKPKKLQQQKKELKREKKQRQREQHRDNVEQEESDTHSEQQSIEEEPEGLSKLHVEFEPEPEVLTYDTAQSSRRASNAEKENAKQKSKKDKKQGKSGILVNKNEPIAVKVNVVVEEQLNTFDQKQPKDVLELKKQEKTQKEEKQTNKKEKTQKKDKHVAEKPAAVVAVEQVAEATPVVVVKEIKQEEKTRQASPKNQQNTHKPKQTKKQLKESTANKELLLALEKLSDTDTIGVSLLMNLFRRAELNRSEIQILIDYLLNKQQDMPSTHSEWSDDICQKLKRQLEEKERALAEEQEASVGIQAKLRELRTEINAERAQMHATVKAYAEKMQNKDQEIAGLNQELHAVNEKIGLERQQFQAKLVQAKQTGSQDLLTQLQMMQNELAHKEKSIAELTLMANASRQAFEDLQQKNEIIQQQTQQILALEQQRDELEQAANNQIFELEKSKALETENAETKVEVCNLQNALDLVKAELAQKVQELETTKSELTQAVNVKLCENQNEIQTLQATNAELSQQLAGISSKTAEQIKEQAGLQAALDAFKLQLIEKEQKLAEFSAKNTDLLKQLSSVAENTQQEHQQQLELHTLIESLKTDVASKNKQLQEAEQNVVKVNSRERELLQQLNEQKEKNNDLRMKNWKLIEALQNAETLKQKNTNSYANANLVQQQQLLAATTQKPSANADSSKDQKQIRELFQRLYPEAVKACAANALSASFEQWVEQVLTTQIKQSISKINTTTTTSSSNKSTQSNSTTSNSNHSNSIHNSHNNNFINSEATINNNNNNNENDNDKSRINNSSSNDSSSSGDNEEVQKLRNQNAQLRSQNDELTKLVTKTSNTLSELEGRARETDEHWRSVIRLKEEEIKALQHSNGAQDI